MSKPIKKLYLVKREVIATSMEKALHARGTVYEVVIAEEKSWPQSRKKVGFDNNNKP